VAYQFTRIGPQSGKKFREYNIDFSVGRGAWNRTEDVMLAQTYLRIVYIENTDPTIREAGSYPPPPDKPDIVVDGIVGPITHRYIMLFKNQLRTNGHNVYADEVMDPFRKNDPFSISTIAKLQYAFGGLMSVAALADEDRNLKKFDVLPEHPDTPAPLKLALSQTRKDARQYGG
jgi:hypothetical protein